MDNEVVTRILRAYGINGAIVGAPQKGYRNSSYSVQTDATLLNLIIYKNEPGILARIKAANATGTAAASEDLATRVPADRRIVCMRAGDRVRYAGLYHYLPGKTIPWEAYTREHIKNLGATMAIMHKNLKRNNVAKLPDVAEENLEQYTRIINYMQNINVQNAMAQKLSLQFTGDASKRALLASKKLPDQQALHMDFVRGNILFERTRVSGVIDFEKAATGSVLYDIARTLAFLIVDCKYKPEKKIIKYFLHSGYCKRGGAQVKTYTVNGSNLLPLLINYFLLHDFYKFLRHNPYESLVHNEHYVRTEALLLKRGLITKV